MFFVLLKTFVYFFHFNPNTNFTVNDCIDSEVLFNFYLFFKQSKLNKGNQIICEYESAVSTSTAIIQTKMSKEYNFNIVNECA